MNNEATPSSNIITAARPLFAEAVAGVNSDFNIHHPDNDTEPGTANPTPNISDSNTQGGWRSLDDPNEYSTSTDNLESGFGSGADAPNPTDRATRTFGTQAVSRRMDENITVTLLPEKEGVFMFQHRNYEVKSARRSSSVVRRYSDFVWLLDCLHKRYPFRQLPLLPPKRVAGLFTFPKSWLQD